MTPSTSTTGTAQASPSLLTMLRSLRPKQWTKNVVVFIPVVFSRELFQGDVLWRAVVGFVAFTAMAAAVYVQNDWYDRAEDRLHPTKRLRPIASGAIGRAGVATLTLICVAVSVSIGSLLGLNFLIVVGTYAVFQIAYTAWLKKIVIVDVMAIAFGFILRIYAGATAIDVAVSGWLFLCAMLFAIFLGFAKRRAELTTLEGDAGAHRRNLRDYSVTMLDQMMSISAACAILAYGLYTVSPETVARAGSDGLKFTVPAVIFGIFRYLFLVHKRGEGGAPEQVLLTDRAIQIDIGLFCLVVGWVLYNPK